jgi:flotillin
MMLTVYLFTFILSLIVPQIAAEVSAPLAKTEEIVLLGGGDSNVTGELTRLVGQVPPAVHALTGVDLSKVSNTCTSTQRQK